MNILTEYDADSVLRHHFHDKEASKNTLKKAIKIYWRKRNNPVARSRIKSAIEVLRLLV